MTNPLDQLNLRPQERRILVVVFFLVFVVLNWMFVRPLFGQWSATQVDLADAQKKLKRYQDEIGKTPSYDAMKTKLRQEGSEVLKEELQLQRIVDQQATAAGVAVNRYAPVSRSTGRTNQFFEDQALTIDFSTYSTNLVDFLVGLASGNSMIRVQEMNLKPDPSGTKLNGNILFVASYQRKTPLRVTSGSQASAVAAPTNKPSSTTQPKPVFGGVRSLTNPAKTNLSQPPRTVSTNKAVKK